MLYHIPANQDDLPCRENREVYHYTKFESFKEILKDLTLKPSSFDKLNDMNEGNVYNLDLNRNFKVMYETEKYIKERCHILCFTQNYDVLGCEFEGANHPAMWAHYAENSNGVCIVIDKDAFLNENIGILSRYFYKFENVEYSFFNSPFDKNINYNAKTPQEFIKDNWRFLFYQKHKDWESENEHRLFIMGYDGKFSIEDCVMDIILGRKIFENESRIKEVLDMIVNPNFACYRKFIPRSFFTTCYGLDGYNTFSIALWIECIINANISDTNYANYKKWLEEQGYHF